MYILCDRDQPANKQCHLSKKMPDIQTKALFWGVCALIHKDKFPINQTQLYIQLHNLIYTAANLNGSNLNSITSNYITSNYIISILYTAKLNMQQ